jgi:hypothetical protein
MILADLADYLTSQGSTGWVQASTLFAGAMPPKPDMALCLYETGGLPSIKAFNPLPGHAKVEQPRVQLVGRSLPEDYAAIRSWVQTAYLLLDGMPTRTINGVSYFWGEAINSPHAMGRDEQNRVLVGFSVDIKKAMSTA